MSISEIRKEAREALRGKWGKGICIVLAYMLFAFLIGIVEGLFENSGFIFLLIEIAIAVISIPLSFGLIISFMKLKRNEVVKAFGFIEDGLSNFKRSWGIWFHTFLRMLVPIVFIILIAIFIVAVSIINYNSNSFSLMTVLGAVLYIATLIYTISRSLLYVIAYNIGYDEPELSSKACVLKSEELMKGNRGKYFLLDLSFIGWAILSVFTLGIGVLWLSIYISVAEVCFYDRLVKREEIEVEEVKIEE